MRLLAAAVAASALLRIALAASLPLADDEAYYWLWSLHLAWGYPEHPPMIAALIALSTRAFGDSPLAIRGVTLLLASATPPLLYIAARSLFNHATGLRAAILIMGLPAVALGSAFAFPDIPLMFFWALGLWTGWRALQRGGWWWVATGAVTAMAILSKLTALFLVLGLAGAWAAGPWRRSLRDPGWYLGMVVGAALISPMVRWNLAHEWAMAGTVLYGPPLILPRSITENLLLFAGGQLVYYGPAVLLLIISIAIAVRRFRDPAWRYLAWMSAPVLLAVLASAVGARGRPHWPGPAYLVAAVAVGALWPSWQRKRASLVWIAAALTGLLTVVLAGAVFLLVGIDVSTIFGRWDRVAQAADQEVADLKAAGREAFILTDGYQSASQITYHLRGRIFVTPLLGAFTLWRPPVELLGQDVVYVHEGGREPRRDLRGFCRNIRVVGHADFMPRRAVATLYRCEDFRGFFRDWHGF